MIVQLEGNFVPITAGQNLLIGIYRVRNNSALMPVTSARYRSRFCSLPELESRAAGDFACLCIHTDQFAFLDEQRHAHRDSCFQCCRLGCTASGSVASQSQFG